MSAASSIRGEPSEWPIHKSQLRSDVSEGLEQTATKASLHCIAHRHWSLSDKGTVLGRPVDPEE